MSFNCFPSPNSSGQPVKIIEIGEDNKLILNENGLKSVLFHPKCKGKQVKYRVTLRNFIKYFYNCFWLRKGLFDICCWSISKRKIFFVEFFYSVF